MNLLPFPNSLNYFISLLLQLNNEYEVYMTLEPLVSKQEAFDILKRLTKWISANKQRLFILSSPTF